MNATNTAHLPPDDGAGARLVCPKCSGPLSRIPRRLIDRILSLVRPVQRYRCRSFGCQWTGNIATHSKNAHPTDRTPL